MSGTISIGISGLLAAAFLRPRLGQFPLLLLGLCLLWVVLLRLALPGFGRRATLAALGATALLVGSWLPRIAARSWGHDLLTPAYYSVVILPATVVEVTVLLSLLTAPLWFPLGLLARRRRSKAAGPVFGVADSAEPIREDRPGSADPIPVPSPGPPTRRQVLGALAWAAPTTALILGLDGVARGAQQLAVRRVRLDIPGLPPSLDGLRIGQITDAHIARDLTPLRQIERAGALLSHERLDLLCATGDLCDDASLLPEVLRLLRQIPARLGQFSCLGNHELYLGLPRVRREHDRAGLHLLEDTGLRLGDLQLAGISYPHDGSPRMSPRAIPGLLDRALGPVTDAPHGPAAPFTLLLSHHPHVIRHVAGRHVGLMLSGHTHGGQLGLGERSPIEPFYGYVRGLYLAPAATEAPPQQAGPADGAPGRTRLFVSSGTGHWLPWRMNCPAEVVVIELRRAETPA